jgi:hypothetical protein
MTNSGKPCKKCGSYALTFNADKELLRTIDACMEDQVVNHGAHPSKLDLTELIEACIYSYISDDKGIMDIKHRMLTEDLQRTLN